MPTGALTLEFHHTAVETSAFHQLHRRTLLGHTAVFQHYDVVGTRHGAHPVGNNQHRLACQQAGERTLHLCLVFHIQAGSGLVQQDDGGVLQKRPGDGDALSLSAGEFCAVFPDGSIISLGQAADELPAVGGLGRGPHFLVGGASLAQTDILHHRVVKEHHILKHHRVIGQQGLRVHRGDVHATYLDASLCYIPQPGSQSGAGTLTGPGRTHQGSHFTLPGGKAHAVQHLFSVVGKTHMVELNIVSLWLKHLCTLSRRGVVDLVHAVGGYLGHKHLSDESQALVKRRIHAGNNQQEQKQQHEVDLPGKNQAGSHQNGGGYPQTHDNAGRIDEDAGPQLTLDGDLLMVVDLLIEPGQIALLLIGGADLPDIFQGFLNSVGDTDRGFFRPLGGPGGNPPGTEQQTEGHRHTPQAGDGQPPVIHQQAHCDNRRGEIGPVQIAQHMGPDMFHAVHIAHNGLGQIRQIPLAEVAQRQFAQPLRQTEPGRFHLVIDQSIGGVVLLKMSHKGKNQEYNHQPE